MKKVLILGAGMVVKPIAHHLLDSGVGITIATRTQSKADEIIAGHPNGRSRAWNSHDEEALDSMVAEHDLTVSLLPYTHHVMVAKHCIKHRKDMVTTSYVQPEMRALDAMAKNAGIIILNELGLDPGIDHMSAMRIIDHIHRNGGQVEEFYSLCGALVAPEVEKNPFGYKFTWAPKGVVMAGNNQARYMLNGKVFEIQTEDLFKNPFMVDFPKVGKLEVYPNRDSLAYIEVYGIPEVKTMYRGTFRYAGWCQTMDAMKRLGLLSYDKISLVDMTYADFVAKRIGMDNSMNIKKRIAEYLGIGLDSTPMVALEWLGLFSQIPINREEDSPFNLVSDIMIEKMMIGENDRDMVAMQHTFVARYPDGKQEVIQSRMLDFGTLKNDTSIARTVALPAAVGVQMILENSISAKGVHIPVLPEIYNPILNALEKLNITMAEEYGLPLSESIK
ncbi:MAG TPA: saccharopine dehydrogenase C-terminal domain-containing protein [Tenuifilaceae bacterium]|nr:saccharopine dehydrogenase C-terminal domain-containing protein [Tenuifilaceae bacterium]